jgi:hypothetical protein
VVRIASLPAALPDVVEALLRRPGDEPGVVAEAGVGLTTARFASSSRDPSGLADALEPFVASVRTEHGTRLAPSRPGDPIATELSRRIKSALDPGAVLPALVDV